MRRNGWQPSSWRTSTSCAGGRWRVTSSTWSAKMLDQVLEWLRRGDDIQALRAELVRLLQERDRLAYENAKLRQENRQLRRRLGDRDLRVLRSAVADALLLGALHFAGQYTSRRAVA